MHTIWSDCIQGIGTLYASRSLRFSDDFKEKYMSAFGLEDGQKILEIGCGPGALAESLKRWYPKSQIFGVDRDSNFIEFASRKNPSISFSEGDAAHLAFEEESFDVTVSNTVAEHIAPAEFYGEQYRVLKKGGVCLVLSARKGINIAAQCIAEKLEFEKDIWQRVGTYFEEIDKKYAVCAYPQNEAEMPVTMEQYGFRNVTTEYITVNLTPDNPIYPKEMAHAMINANRQTNLDAVEALYHVGTDVVSESEIKELKRIVNEKYDKRLELYDAGRKQWDANVSVTMIMRGIK